MKQEPKKIRGVAYSRDGVPVDYVVHFEGHAATTLCRFRFERGVHPVSGSAEDLLTCPECDDIATGLWRLWHPRTPKPWAFARRPLTGDGA